MKFVTAVLAVTLSAILVDAGREDRKLAAKVRSLHAAPAVKTREAAPEKNLRSGATQDARTPYPTYVYTCEDLPGWVDWDGDDCEWYEDNEPEGCPDEGDTMGNYTMGGYLFHMEAMFACCHCHPQWLLPRMGSGSKTGKMIGKMTAKTVSPSYGGSYGGSYDGEYGGNIYGDGAQIKDGWIDEYGDSCGYYETFSDPGCPEEGSVTGIANDGMNYTAWEACSHCAASPRSHVAAKSPHPTPGLTGDDFWGAIKTPGWIDNWGDSCGWFERNVPEGCPNTWNVTGVADDGNTYTAEDACIWCEYVDRRI